MMMKRSKGPTAVAWTVLLIIVSLLLAAKVYRHQINEESEKKSPSEILLDSRRSGGHSVKPVEGRLEVVDRHDIAAAEAAVGDEAARASALPVFDPNRHHAELNDGEVEAGFADRHPEHSTLGFVCTPRDSICNEDDALMMVVFSRPEGRGSRSAIRKTWAKFDSIKYASSEIKWFTVFVIGTTRSEWLKKEVEEESGRHGDILQGDLEDGLFEDTPKFMLTLKWLLASATSSSSSSLRLRCAQHLRFVIKSVDNIFHNMVSITGWLNAKYPPAGDRGLYVGKLLRRDAPIRDRAHPLFVARGDFGGEHFPDLIQGPVYMFSYDSLVEMSRAMGRVKPIAMEDGYIALLARDIGIQPKHNDHFQMLTHIRDGCHYLRMFFIYNVLPSDHIVIFNDIAKAQQSRRCVAKQHHRPRHMET